MRVKVEFRYNSETGEVELFQVDDLGRTTRVRDHDAAHDEIAFALGQVLERRPGVEEVVDTGHGAAPVRAPEPDDPEAVRRRERARE
ncbi:hypothetical protein ACIQPR_13700 [Streptomyces sp. NPDC091280]|uniref:hypothetical protein n=1 Tax=Streptomyces sp. NPDC091280 TaxID=3365984 RepID=UPI0037FBF4B7